jgi:ABC-type nitrate/sulfonate/bicarbonate transport system permease component
MPFSVEALFIVLAVGFFLGIVLALVVDGYPVFKRTIDTLVEAVKDLKKFKKKQPIEL